MMYVIMNHSLSSTITENVLFVVLSKGFGSIRRFLTVFFYFVFLIFYGAMIMI